MKAFIAMPMYTDAAAHTWAVQRALVRNGLEVPFAFESPGSSFLTKNFNSLWVTAIAGGYDVFLMLHGDIVPDEGWAGTLLRLLEEHGADVVSATSPIKNEKGYTSCGVGDPHDTWTPLFRFTKRQLQGMPGTFTAADIGWDGYPLLINTGCWIADLRKPWVRQTDDNGNMVARFEVNNRVTFDEEENLFRVEGESEDWFFSRRLHELGCKTMITQAVKLHHYGVTSWPNAGIEGQVCDELAVREHVLPQLRARLNGDSTGYLAEMIKAVSAGVGVHERGYWINGDTDGHRFDSVLAGALCALKDSVLDLGCGLGKYVARLRQGGIDARGIDGNPHTVKLSGGVCEVQDLTEPLDLGAADWVTSIEVGEHIPAEHEPVYLDNVARHCRKGVVLSWATEGQTGRGHVNPHDQQYVVDRMAERGLVIDERLTNDLRNVATIGYLKRNLMVFIKQTEQGVV